MNETSKPKSRWRILRRLLIALAVLATLVAIFYTEENWRGKRAWENCKRDLEAQGVVLDWDKFIPPPVPDDQNFFMASTNILLRFHKSQTAAQADAAKQSQWLCLPPHGSNSFPVLDFAKTKPLVAILTVCSSAATGASKNSLLVQSGDPATPGQIQGLIRTTAGRSIIGAAGVQFSQLQLSNLVPASIVLISDTSPSLVELARLVPPDTVTNLGRLAIEATADPQSFEVKLVSGRVTAASDYLHWSEQITPALDEIRVALQRPYAQIPGDYSNPFFGPIPDFVTLRGVAQALVQRAQCYLLLGQPEPALRELSLVLELCRILEHSPTGQPTTLVEAMINVAISGLYVSTVADGCKLHAWQEPQLIEMQAQLKDVDLPPSVAAAFRMELAGATHLLERTPASKLADLLNMASKVRAEAGNGFWARVKNPLYLFLKLAPRGWVCQNLVVVAECEAAPLAGFDLGHNILAPRIFDAAIHELDRRFNRKSLFTICASLVVPNFAKAAQALAHTQTLVNEAQIVCALERYRLAHGSYPETLAELEPQFIQKLPHDIIGGQPLHYRRTEAGKFLLYSVGWNETDDGGVAGKDKSGHEDRTQGDWVWEVSPN